MDIVAEDLTSKTDAFQLKGSLFTLTTLLLLDDQIDKIKTQLAAQLAKSQGFFKHAPIILDLSKLLSLNKTLDFSQLSSALRELSLIPVGIRGGSEGHNQQAIAAGLAVLATPKSVNKEAARKQAPSARSGKVITRPVRSGQQVYAEGSDLIVLASVSAGAELLADGHIHVYGSLRGRALAGVKGDKSARIFCRSLEAELVSIAGHYWVSDDLKAPFSREGVQVYLEDERLRLGVL